MKRVGILSTMVFLWLFLLTAGGAYSQDMSGAPANELFEDVKAPADFHTRQEMTKHEPAVVRSRHVSIRLDYLDGKDLPEGAGSIGLNLFDNVYLTAVKDRFERRSGNQYTWVGHISGIEFSQVVIVVENGVVAGNITSPDGIYQIRFVGDGIHAVRKIDQSAFPREAPPIPVITAPDRSDIPAPQTRADTGAFIDVMVVYTPAARAGAGGATAMDSLIQLAVDETNQSYANSGITQRIRLVHKAEVAYTESGNFCNGNDSDLERLRGTSDGYMDEVHAMRDAYGADLVSLIVESGDACGCAYLMTSVSTSFAPSAFSVVERDCATGYYSFGHELGHNMGANHDWYVDSGTAPFPYAHGYIYTPGRWRTIMSYNDECAAAGFNCTRLQYWSNPDISYNGVPIGTPEGQYQATDNRKTLNNTASTVANFRQSQFLSPSEGTLGTRFTITGFGFGTKKPTVYLEYEKNGATKQAKAKVISWSDTSIICTWGTTLPPDTYSTFVKPSGKGMDPISVGTFSVMSPAIDGIAPNTCAIGDRNTISGKFFSSQKPKVYLRNTLTSKQYTCKVISFSMDPDTGDSSLQFSTPKVTSLDSGDYELVLQNKIGRASADFCVPQPAQYGTLQVVNNYTFSITQLYISPTSSPVWGSNQIASPILPGGYVTFSLMPDSYDLKAVASDGGSVVSNGIIIVAGQTFIWTLY